MLTLAWLSWKTNVLLAVLALAYPIAIAIMSKKKPANDKDNHQDRSSQ